MGLWWVRNKLQGKPRPAAAPELLVANEDSKESLSYAIRQIKNPSTEPELKMPSAKDMLHFLSELRLISHKPDMFSKAVYERLVATDVSQISDRTLLLDEMSVVLNNNSQGYSKYILDYEQKWFVVNFKKIKDQKALHNYMQVLVKLTARTYKNPQERLAEFKKMAQPLKKDAFALRSFRAGLVQNSQWDITDIFENMPNNLKLYVQGKRK